MRAQDLLRSLLLLGLACCASALVVPAAPHSHAVSAHSSVQIKTEVVRVEVEVVMEVEQGEP